MWGPYTMIRSFLLLFFILITFSIPARAEISDALALNAQKSIDSFTCSAIASYGGDEEYSQRLFAIGYGEGKIFLAALNGNIAGSDLGNKVPAVFAAARGPNADFALGRVYQENMMRSKAYFDRHSADPAQGKAEAARKFDELKCGALKSGPAVKTR